MTTTPTATVARDTPEMPYDAVDRGFLSRLAVRTRLAVSSGGHGRHPQSLGRDQPTFPADARPRGLQSQHGAAAGEFSNPPETGRTFETGAAAQPGGPWHHAAAAHAPRPWEPPDPGPRGPLVDRLLHAAPRAWEAIARRVEDAHAAGATVIAVTGGRVGEGRTTVVSCLAQTLTARGRRVDVCERAPVDARLGADAPIVLVDAGVWFPGGPIRRAWLERASLGCHAAILVRRGGQPECAARGEAIEALGLGVLGEVLTMVPADEAPACGD